MVLDKYLRYLALLLSLVVLSYLGVASLHNNPGNLGLSGSSQNPGHAVSEIFGKIGPSNISPQGEGSTLNADTVRGEKPGNSDGDIPLNNGIKNTNLIADLLDGRHAGNDGGNIPVSDGDKNTGLHADLLDGYEASEIIDAASGGGGTSLSDYRCPSGEFADGINSDGTLKCEDAVTSEASTSAVCGRSCGADILVGSIPAKEDGMECKAVAEEGSCTVDAENDFETNEPINYHCCVASETSKTKKTVALCSSGITSGTTCEDVCQGKMVSSATGNPCSIEADVGSCSTDLLEGFPSSSGGQDLCCECELP